MNIQQAFELALGHHQAGRLAEAEALYRQVLAVEPRQADALHMLGVLAHQVGRNDVAAELIGQAIAVAPGVADFHSNLGEVHRAAGQPEAAIAAYRRALALDPNIPEAHYNAGIVLSHAGRMDEAIAAYRTALQLQPDSAAAWNNLGLALKAKGQPEEAIAAFRAALRGGADDADAFTNLGDTLNAQGRPEEALAAYRSALALKPDSPDLQHLLAALTGARGATTSTTSFVRKLFDEYAGRFDEHLVGQLGYRVPELFLEAVVAVAPGRQFDILDLGCGTGLCGVQFRPLARSLTGVDLAPRMIAKAAARGIYDRLITGDVADAMRDEEGSFDLILAGDLFIYVGDLGGVFPAAARTLRDGGLFAFSLERHDGEGFVLHSKVRFAHSLGYIRELARKHHFAEAHVREITVRKEGAQDVAGWLVVLRKATDLAG